MSVEGQPTLIKFLLWLVDDPKRLEEFRRDRWAYELPPDAPPITTDQREVLNTNDPLRILHVIDYELGFDASAQVVYEQAAAAQAPPRPQPAVLVIT